jgi:putative CocE/NonD family hydrolase
VTVQKGTQDETHLAVDIFFPKKDGKIFFEHLDKNGQPTKPVKVKLPVILTIDLYHRANVLSDGSIVTYLDMTPWLQEVIKHGYVIGIVDARGSGASYGSRPGPFTRVEARDAYDIIEWFAEQEWCNGNVGMFGRSYMGINQYTAASMAPPHLRCIFPQKAMFDLYSFVYPGGVFRYDFMWNWTGLVIMADLSIAPFPLVAPVDADTDGTQRDAAILEHYGNRDMYPMATPMPYRDSVDPETGEQFHLTLSPSSYLNDLNYAGVPIYHLAGWYDMWPRDQLVWFNNLDNPQKIVITPWSHMTLDDSFLAAEHLRWYDYWLKDIDNGVMDEPPIYYFTMGAPEGKEWRFAKKWPLRNELPLPFYFHPRPTASIDSVNDGSLRLMPPARRIIAKDGYDEYTADYTTTTGLTNRWTDGYGGGFGYPDMTSNDEKGLTYTSPPLPFDVQVTGHPVVHLWVSSTAQDVDFFAYLEEVDESGFSHYITEGTLRASHRATTIPPFDDYMGLPWHRSFIEDVSDLPNEPVELAFDLHPTSNVFDRGHRIRVTITCADKDNFFTPVLSPPPTVTVYHNASYASHITLPIIRD